MTIPRLTATVLILGAAAFAGAAAAAGGPPPPKATTGPVTVVGTGIPTPTAIAIGGGTTFVAAGGSESKPKAAGGVFVAKAGKATRIPGSPPVVYGLAWKDGTLYGTAGSKVLAWSGWNGKTFATTKTVYTAPKGFAGFNGISVGPDGRLYTGASLTSAGDHKAATTPYGNSLLSMKPDGSDVTVVAKGLRQPWQIAFIGSKGPYVTDLGQDNLGKKQPPDYVVLAKAGQNYGFPACNWSKPSACKAYPKPLALLPAHSSPMGIGAVGDQLYVALFGGLKGKPEVVSIPGAGGAPKPVITGFAAPVVALTTSGGKIYVGDLTGTVYSAKAPGS